jgi:hypothetical protein
MAPAVLGLVIVGWSEIWPLLRESRRVAAACALIGVMVAGGYLVDLYTTYPSRAAQSFYAGFQDAVLRARSVAPGHRLFVSASIEEPVIQVAVVLHPTCDGHLSRQTGMTVVRNLDQLASPGRGDLLIVAAGVDAAPAGAVYLFSETAAVHTSTFFPDHTFPPSSDGTTQHDLFDVYQI